MDLFTDGKGPARSQMGRLCVTGKAAEMLERVSSMVDFVAQTHQIKRNDVVVIPVLNWSAPSLISSDDMKSQSQVLAAVLQMHGDCAASAILCPSHSYTRGALYKQMENLHQLLANCRVNFDVQFCLPYRDRPDERDQRPSAWKTLLRVSFTKREPLNP